MPAIKIPEVKCLRCGHRWLLRKARLPKVCPHPKCKSKYWNIPRRKKVSK